MNKVVVSLYGGLGNQLFQYATGYALSKHHNCKLILDLAWFDVVPKLKGTTPRKFSLDPFHLDVEQQHVGINRLWSKLQRLPLFKRGQMQLFREQSFQFDPKLFMAPAPLWLDGYWQSPKYFEKWASDIRHKIGKPNQMSPKTKEMMSLISHSDSVCVHIRRGDYVTNAQAKECHGLCSLDYYREGIKRVTAHVGNPHGFIFSDDPAWVQKHFKVEIPFTVIDINGPDEAHEDLWLMAACKYFVIANSSLSWWGAWLSESPSKVVVAPLDWFKDNPNQTRDLIPQGWIQI